ncbi:MAG: VanZ family protein, partial [Phycisphaerae bacterium]|nr:VanZ family protein [Phycisphaerae bacterium]
RKLLPIVLIFYWVGIFFATHIPVPDWTRKMGVSDKIMHFAAYLVLMLLLWLSINFEKKANWKKIQTWLLMGIVAVYAVFDEGSQYFIGGRSADFRDVIANLLGVGGAMILVTILSGRHTAMIPFAICPIFLPALVRSKLIPQGTIIEAGIYAAVFVIITIAWIRYISFVYKFDIKRIRYIPIFLGGPTAILAIVKTCAVFTSKPMEKIIIISTLAFVVLALIICRLVIPARKSCKASR